MPHVNVDAPGIRQEPAISRWLIVSTMVQVEDPSSFDLKNVVANPLRHPGGGMVGPILVHKEAVFRFKPEDTVQHVRWRPVR